MKGNIRVSTLLFYGVTAFMIVFSIVSFACALSWFNRPFAGFMTYQDGYVGTYRSRDWPGMHAGLTYMDRIVAVDGQPVQDGRDVLRAVRKKTLGTPVVYKVKSRDTFREVTVPVTLFGPKDFFLTFLVTFLGGFILFVLGFIVYLLKPNTSASWVFLMLCLFLGTYMVSAYEVHSTYILVSIHTLALCFMPAPFYHFGLIFPDKKRILTRWPILQYLIYLPAVILAIPFLIYVFNYQNILNSGPLSWLPGYEELGLPARLYALLGVFSIIVFVIHSLFKSSTPSARQRARVVLYGVTIAFLPSVLFMLMVNLKMIHFPYNFIVFFVIFFPASMAYAIVRHNLFDADTIIRRTVGYVVVTAVVVGAYALISVSFNVLLGKYQLAQSKAFPIFFTLGVILVFNPLRDHIQALVDRVFFRKEYDYGEVIDKIGGAITSLMDLGQILKQLTQTFIKDMFIDTTSVMLLSPDGSAYQVYLADGEKRQDIERIEIKRDTPLVEIIEKEKKELTKYDVLEDKKFQSVAEGCAASFEALHASLMVPLVFQDKVIGLLNLGEKKSGKAYNREDIDLLHTVSNQGAVAIENARLFQENLEKQRMEEELNIARDLQTSMLPADCPQIEGFEIAAFSISAREVGGDFYDFIEMADDKVGMVVGDVTGKSVSGALVMSASRSVFRMLSEEESTVAERMIRANRRIKKDVKSGMFVALLYAVLDGKGKSVNLCSAGQTQPIHRSAKTGEASLLETTGDTFPLGILDEVDYKESQIQLEVGDKVVFYTDGIVEAMNEQEEMFGFERLLQAVHEAKTNNAEALLTEILGKVNDFAGKADQHDDLTIIVVSVTA